MSDLLKVTDFKHSKTRGDALIFCSRPPQPVSLILREDHHFTSGSPFISLNRALFSWKVTKIEWTRKADLLLAGPRLIHSALSSVLLWHGFINKNFPNQNSECSTPNPTVTREETKCSSVFWCESKNTLFWGALLWCPSLSKIHICSPHTPLLVTFGGWLLGSDYIMQEMSLQIELVPSWKGSKELVPSTVLRY